MVMLQIEREEDNSSDNGSYGLSSLSVQSDVADRVVSFAPRVRAKRVLRKEDYSSEEREATWYDQEELSEISVKNYVTAGLFKKGTLVHDDEVGYTKRGLEHLDVNEDGSDDQPTAKEHRLVCTITVLREQQVQKTQGIQDPERIAAFYAQITKPSKEDARTHALLDEKVARQIANEKDDERVGEYHACVSRASKLRARRGERIREAVFLVRRAA